MKLKFCSASILALAARQTRASCDSDFIAAFKNNRVIHDDGTIRVFGSQSVNKCAMINSGAYSDTDAVVVKDCATASNGDHLWEYHRDFSTNMEEYGSHKYGPYMIKKKGTQRCWTLSATEGRIKQKIKTRKCNTEQDRNKQYGSQKKY